MLNKPRSEKNIRLFKNLNEAKLLFSCLEGSSKSTEVRFVGGCVRKALSGESIDDIDLATTLEPNEVKKRLTRKGIKVIDTGISHGTVTAILKKTKFEITTLRKDVSTDGRHANVRFTLDWKEDALRRDFTINAIYADVKGKIYDPLDGVSDLQKGVVKFVGSSTKRIHEDYLRILRYFRFFLQYSKIRHKKNIIDSIQNNISGLQKVSGERMLIELKKILKLENVLELFLDETSKKAFLNIFPQLKHHNRLQKFQDLSKNIKEQIDEFFILSLLIVDRTDNYRSFCNKYKTSNKIKDRFSTIAKYLKALEHNDFFEKENIMRCLYYNSKEMVKELLLFAFFINDKIRNSDLKKSVDYLSQCKKPVFPVSGNFLKEKGFKSGKKLGKILKELENKWISNNFHLDENAIDELLKK